METIRVLLADDHTLFRRALADLINRQPGFHVVGEAPNGAEAVKQAVRLKPDLVLMDIHMPELDGIQATQQLASKLSDTRIVMLTVSEEDQDLFKAIQVGAHGYLLKKIEPESLFELLRGVFRGEAPLSRNTAMKILKRISERGAETITATPAEALTERELEVLKLLATGKTNKEIGAQLNIAENTVKNHLKNILAKLHLENRVQAAAMAVRQGLVPKDPAGK